ncbi:MAG: pyrroline-5-carboxylate reductase [Candidatus Omnitrophota bacterium]|nr:pyrroline-5-carboxylate reductase [Candidatus Omnitrophota bacterium]
MIDLRKKIGIIGCGNMGSAIARNLALLKSEFSVFAFDQDKDKLIGIPGIGIAKDLKDLLEESETIILAVKPQDFDHLLKEVKKGSGNKLIISIAAGISTKRIEKVLGGQIRVIRAMPNIGVKVGESVTCLAKGAFATDEDLDLAQELFNSLGAARIIDEGMMNAATAISGSGPAYIFYFIENSAFDSESIPEHARHDMMRRLEKAAEDLGFSLEDAAFLAANTTNASISLLHKTKLPAQELRKQVTSKGGTTEAALEILTKGGSWEEAARSALKRAEELARPFAELRVNWR